MEFTKWLFLGLGVLVLVGMIFAQGNEDKGFGDKLQIDKEAIKQKLDEGKKQFEMKSKEWETKFNNLKDRVKEKVNQYKEKKENWEKSKNGFPGLGLMLDSNDGRKVTIDYLQTLSAKIQDHFSNMQDKNQNYSEYFSLKADEVNNLISKLDENSTKEEILAAIKEIKNIWNNSEHQRKIVIAEKYVDGVDKVTAKLETALNNLDSKLDKIEAASLVDTNTARTQYYKAVESLANLKLEITSTQEQLKTQLSDENVDVKSVNTILKNLNDSIHSAKQEVVKAIVEYNKLKNDFAKATHEDSENKDINESLGDSNANTIAAE